MLIQVINFPKNCVTFLKEYLKILAFNFCRSWLEKLRLSEERKVEEAKQLEVWFLYSQYDITNFEIAKKSVSDF